MQAWPRSVGTDLSTAKGKRGRTGGCLQKHVELPPSINVTRVGFRDGWLPGGSSTTPVDFRALYPPRHQTRQHKYSQCEQEENVWGFKSAGLLFSGKRDPALCCRKCSVDHLEIMLDINVQILQVRCIFIELRVMHLIHILQYYMVNLYIKNGLQTKENMHF